MSSNVGSPLVSILVPIYDVERYIVRCARSLFEQTYPYLEFVFVDDCCEDSSVTILKNVIDNYPSIKEKVILINHQQNRGLAASRNTAVNNCHGDFVLHVDSDDWIESNAVELLIDKQQKTDSDIVYFQGYYRETEETVKCECYGWCSDKEVLLETLLQGRAASCVWGKLIKRSLYTDHNIQCVEQGSYYEGFQILSQLIYYSRTITCSNAYFYHYNRLNPNSIVTNVPNSIEIQRQGAVSILAVCDFFQNHKHCYLDIVKGFYVRYIYRMLIINGRYRNQKGYLYFLSLLEKVESNYWFLIGWNSSWKRMIYKCYYLISLFLQITRFKQKIFSVLKR